MPRSFRDAFDISRSLSSGLEALQAAPWPLLLGAVLMQCTENSGGNYSGSSPSGGGGSDPWGDYDSWESHDWLGLGARAEELTRFDLGDAAGNIGGAELGIIVVIMALVLGLGLCCGLLVLAFRSWVHGGYIRLHEEVLRTDAGSFATLFGAADSFLRMMGFKLVAALIHTGIFLLALVPGGVLLGVGLYLDSVPLLGVGGAAMLLIAAPCSIYVWLGLYFGNHAVALDDASVVGAVERSWELVRGHRLWLLLYLVVTGLVWAIGMCFCCVGIFLTRAVVDTARTEAYLLATRDGPPADPSSSLRV